MKTFSSAHLTDHKKDASERRYRNIAANSGEIMESNEIRDVQNFYVMGRDAKLHRIADLAVDPDKQPEKYSLNLVMNHGHFDPVTGERVVGVEDIIGDARVWMEDDGLHARVYFANDDPDADHCWAISDNASYSIGADHYPDGYEGAGNVIEEPIAILREISMVDTGNDPRAVTIDTNSGKGASGAAAGDKNLTTKGTTMHTAKKSIDQLTPDERVAMAKEIDDVIDKFTTDAPESETQPTARDNKEDDKANETTDSVETEEDGATEPTAARNTNDRVAHQTVRIVKDRAVHQERAIATKDWLTSDAGHQAFARCLKQAGKLGATFDGLWRNELSKHVSLDGITGLPTPTNIVSLFRDALEKNDGIISHFEFVNAKGLKINLVTAVTGSKDLARAHGFKKGDTKVNQELANTIREVLCKMVYKRLSLDAMEVWENPELIDFRARELVDAIIVEIERAAVIGDGRSAPAEGKPDLRMFDGTNRGFISIKSDAAATTGFGTLTASTYTQVSGDNAYDTVIKARANIRKEGRQIIIAKNSWVATALTAKVGSNYLVQPGMKIEDVLGVVRVYTPAWMDGDTNDAYLVVDKAYKMVGENRINTHADFDTSTNENILLDETPRGGALGEYKSAVAIAPVSSAPATQSAK